MPEGFNNPNAPDFPGLNSNGGPSADPQFNSIEDINSTSNYPNYNNNIQQPNNNIDTFLSYPPTAKTKGFTLFQSMAKPSNF